VGPGPEPPEEPRGEDVGGDGERGEDGGLDPEVDLGGEDGRPPRRGHGGGLLGDLRGEGGRVGVEGPGEGGVGRVDEVGALHEGDGGVQLGDHRGDVPPGLLGREDGGVRRPYLRLRLGGGRTEGGGDGREGEDRGRDDGEGREAAEPEGGPTGAGQAWRPPPLPFKTVLALPGQWGRGRETGARPGLRALDLYPLVVATAVSLLVYSQQALLLLTKVDEVFAGVFDTSVPAFPLAGMLFVLVFMFLRRGELAALLAERGRDGATTAAGVALAVAPLPVVLLAGGAVGGSYVFAAFALATCWVGVAAAVRPPVFRFLWPYLVAYMAAVGSVSALTAAYGDPLAAVVAAVSRGITALLGLQVRWSSVYMSFTAAGGTPVSLYISQECSGVASISIFLLLMGLMHLDVRPKVTKTLVVGAFGALLFVFLNAVRVVALVAGGIYGGTGLLWSLHGWIGYVLYVAGYAAILLLYMKGTPQS
jgi:exosortase/archaeosortase family protein